MPPATRAPETAIDAVALRKTYPGGRGRPPVRALDGLSFAVPTGTVFALLGPNGAGKSTTTKILATLSRADSGTAHVAGTDVARHPERVRRAIGYVAQKPVTDPMDTGRENLVLAGRLQGLGARDARARAAELLDRFSLTHAADRLVTTYSGGMARKLDVAMGLVHRPQVLFLDEPTTGLDPEARAEMWAEIERMTAVESMTILLTTHYLEEAENLCRNVAIIDKGRIIENDRMSRVLRKLQTEVFVFNLRNPITAPPVLPGYTVTMPDDHTLEIEVSKERSLNDIFSQLTAAGIEVLSMRNKTNRLEELFMRLVTPTQEQAVNG